MRYLCSDHRSPAFREVIAPVVILFPGDPAVYVFLLHGIPVIQVTPEIGSGLCDELVQMQTCDIINEVRHVNRVMYDITSKPPGTIELE